MSFRSIPLTIREVKATEDVLERLYLAARKGLRGDALAYAANILPTEFRRLTQLDPAAEYAVAKGHADTEAAMADVLIAAAQSGDAKMALEYLRHRADWTAAQKVEVTGSQAISITVALERAQSRLEVVGEAPPALLSASPATTTHTAHADAEVLPRG